MEEYKLKIPPKGEPGRGRIAYMIYMLEEEATWLYVDTLMGVVEGSAWKTAKLWAQRNGLQWPPVDHKKVKRARR